MSAAARRDAGRTPFGLDTVLPADPATVEADLLRLLREKAPAVVVLRPQPAPDRRSRPGHRPAPALPRGVPDLVLLGPGASGCLRIRPQAARRSREEAAFEDLCRSGGVGCRTVRSLREAEAALQAFGLLAAEG